VFDNVTITYRGATYEIGRGSGFYGVWTVGGPRSRPLERWPETPEGWTAAWTRFVTIEAPDTIAPVGRNTPPVGAGPLREGGKASRIMAAALLGAGVILGIAGLFPAYIGSASLAQQPDQVTPHAIYLAAWTASAVLILLGGARLRIGALLSLGLSAVTFGLFLADAGTAISAAGNAGGGAGLVLSLIGWVACAAGTVVAFLPGLGSGSRAASAARPGALAQPRGTAAGPMVLVILAGLGAAAAFAPSWDSFTLRTAAGQVQTLTAGNAFSNPALVITGDVVVMIAFAAAVIAAALWRPARHGAVLLAGATIPMAAQAISALVQVGEAHGPAQFGVPPATARQLGLTISAGLTPAFWVYFGFLIALIVSCVWMLFTPQPVPATTAATMPAAATPDAAGTDVGIDAGTDAGTEASHAPAADRAPTADHAAAGARDGDGPA
jgi:hypothetical protein